MKKISVRTGSLRFFLAALSIVMVSVSSPSLLAEGQTFTRPKIHKSGPYLNSDILVSSGFHTVVPKHAVLVVPDRLQQKKASKPSGRFIIWPKFLNKNYGWLYKQEVTLDQASGKTPLTEEKMEQLKSLGKVVVAVYKNNPISVLPPKTTEQE